MWNYNFDSAIARRIGLWEGYTAYAYDTLDRVASLLNPYEELTTAAYDALGRESYRIAATGMRVVPGSTNANK